MDGFTKSLDELLQFAESLKLREKDLEQQHQSEINKIKQGYEFQLQIDKGRIEQLQEHNRLLTEEVERGTQKRVDSDQKHSVLVSKYSCAVEETKRFRDQYHEKTQRVEELEKIVRILRNDTAKLDNELKQLASEKQLLDEKLQQMLITQAEQSAAPPAPPITTAPALDSEPASPPMSDHVRGLMTQAITENTELRKLLVERDNDIRRLNEQLNKSPSEDPQLIEQRCLHLIKKLKTDFSIMYENQSKFFLEKIDLLKREQRDNIAKIYEH